MRIVSAQLRNFRCFSTLQLDFESPVVLIFGPNGSGKTSILEALHYACYLRSFKTHLPKEIVQSQAEGFGVGLGLLTANFDTLQVQFNKNKRSVKLNQQGIGSYRELYNAYRVVTITEDDLLMIQGAPSLRRSFLDHMVLLNDPDHALLAKKYKTIVDNRTALIASGKIDQESYSLWTDQLLTVARKMQSARKAMLSSLALEAAHIAKSLPGMESIADDILRMDYCYARPYTDIESVQTTQELLDRYPGLQSHEMAQRRSLIGAHLDDFTVHYLNKSCRTYASRGQQKLIVFLLKLAQLKHLAHTNSRNHFACR